MANIELVSTNIYAKALQMHQEYKKLLEHNHKELKKEIKKAETQQKTGMIDQQTQITSLLEQSSEPPTREAVIQFLTKLRTEFLEQVAEGKTPEEVSESMGIRVFKGGVKTM